MLSTPRPEKWCHYIFADNFNCKVVTDYQNSFKENSAFHL